MLGDAETHFELLSGRAELIATAGEEVAASITQVDSTMVFLTLTMLVPAPLLTQLSFIYEFVTGSNAADAGFDAIQLSKVMSQGVKGLCILLGAKPPEKSIFEKTSLFLIQDADNIHNQVPPMPKHRMQCSKELSGTHRSCVKCAKQWFPKCRNLKKYS